MTQRYTTAEIQLARELYAGGWNIAEICRVIASETGRSPSRGTVTTWVDDNYRLRRIEKIAARQRVDNAKTATFRLSSRSLEYQAAFVRRLRDEDVTVRGIARCCRVVFGGRWTEYRVKQLLEEAA